jgi:uncharacterized protein (DUF1800 family)
MRPFHSDEKIDRRGVLRAAGLASLAFLAEPAARAAAETIQELEQPADQLPQAPLPLPPLAVIALSRAAFGTRPGSFDFDTFNNQPGATESEKMAAFVDWQLAPQSISDTECDLRLASASLFSINKSLTQLWNDYRKTANADRVRPVKDVRNATFIRAVYSRRQLLEVMAQFWHNHFNIFAWDYAYASPTWMHYDRDVIRPNALGNFRQLLEAVAISPAMLFYLDNYINNSGGPNENWAREVFELHTLGAENYLGVAPQSAVPGYPDAPIGYVDADVYEATRCFTGWRVNDGQYPLTTNTGEFLYYDAWHDRFQKTVLGHFIAANGAAMADGRTVLDLLAYHPGTARFISRKLCRHFISDNPPQSVVDAAAAEFLAHSAAPDQIKRVLRVILLSDEFKNTWGEKIRRPFEVTVALLRATNATYMPSDEFYWNFDDMNQGLFEHRPPNGYSDVKEGWTNSTSLLKRWQMALSLTENWIDQTTISLGGQMPSGNNTANSIVDYWIQRVLGRAMYSSAQRGRVVDFMRGPYSAGAVLSSTYIAERLHRMVALLLMSADFQYR